MDTPVPSRQHWDIFCTVIDNFGDIGITWRLARQLTQEHGMQVRLWVDDLASFSMLRPEIDPTRARQHLESVEICHWNSPFPACEAADVVIEALACELPAPYIQAMAARPVPPVWINLEYLTAEDWILGCHGLPSPHPRLPLTKYFFFPGYTAETGGVLMEHWLPGTRDAFQASTELRARFWHRLGIPAMQDDGLRISLFGYENRAVGRLLADWSANPYPVTCLFPMGRLQGEIAGHFGQEHLTPGMTLCTGALSLHVLPMLSLDEYDRLLWACDCNFVRGEDSFVRAQWANRPMVWQAYRQEEDAHWPKIQAFLTRFGQGLDPSAATALQSFWTAWNAEDAAALEWAEFWQHREALRRHAHRWAAHLESLGDLASNLVKFCNKKL